MINLILKDFKIIKRIIFLGIAYGFLLAFIGTKSIMEGTLNQGFSTFYTLFMTYFSLIYANGYDEKNKANFFIRSLPISKGHIVISKYITIAAYTIFYYVLFSISVLISNIVLSGNSTVFDYRIFIIILVVNMVVYGLHYPFYFKYGAKFLQIFKMVGFLVIFIIPSVFTRMIKSIDKNRVIEFVNWTKDNQQIFAGFLLLIAAAITIITALLSIRIFNNKDMV